MEIRHAAMTDLDEIMVLYEAARAFMREHGNPTQWVNGYPGRELIAGEIEQGHSFVCADQEKLLAVFSLIRGDDPTYREIYEGAWLNEEPYGVIHRLCAGQHSVGAATACINWCFQQCGNLRIDTHQDNIPMQRLLKKCGFVPCGRIVLADGTDRIAFQKC